MPHGTHRDRGHVNDLSTPRTLGYCLVVRKKTHLEKYELVNGKDYSITYIKWKITNV